MASVYIKEDNSTVKVSIRHLNELAPNYYNLDFQELRILNTPEAIKARFLWVLIAYFTLHYPLEELAYQSKKSLETIRHTLKTASRYYKAKPHFKKEVDKFRKLLEAGKLELSHEPVSK